MAVVAVRPHLVWGPGDTQLIGRIIDRARAGRLAIVGPGAALIDTTYIDNAVDALVMAVDRVAPKARCSGRAYVISNFEPRPVEGWDGGFFCPCHGSKFDLAGRVFKGVPAPTNLRVPPYRFVRDDLILIGQDSGVA